MSFSDVQARLVRGGSSCPYLCAPFSGTVSGKNYAYLGKREQWELLDSDYEGELVRSAQSSTVVVAVSQLSQPSPSKKSQVPAGEQDVGLGPCASDGSCLRTVYLTDLQEQM